MYPVIHRILVLFVLFLLLASAAAQTAGSADKSAAPPEDENSPKARALIAKAIEALGGQAYLAYQSRSEEGRLYTFFRGESNSVGAPFVNHGKYPDKERLEIIKRGTYLVPIPLVGIIGVSHQVKNKDDLVIIHNGDKGYEITYKGTAAEAPADTANYLRRRRHSLDAILRKWINEPGAAFFYHGPAVAENKPAEQIEIVNAQNDSVSLFLDQDTHLPIKTSYSWRDPTDKYRNVEDQVYDGYKLVQGIMTPHSITRFSNGEMSHQRFLKTVVYNQDMSDSIFQASVTYDPRAPQRKR